MSSQQEVGAPASKKTMSFAPGWTRPGSTGLSRSGSLTGGTGIAKPQAVAAPGAGGIPAQASNASPELVQRQLQSLGIGLGPTPVNPTAAPPIIGGLSVAAALISERRAPSLDTSEATAGAHLATIGRVGGSGSGRLSGGKLTEQANLFQQSKASPRSPAGASSLRSPSGNIGGSTAQGQMQQPQQATMAQQTQQSSVGISVRRYSRSDMLRIGYSMTDGPLKTVLLPSHVNEELVTDGLQGSAILSEPYTSEPFTRLIGEWNEEMERRGGHRDKNERGAGAGGYLHGQQQQGGVLGAPPGGPGVGSSSGQDRRGAPGGQRQGPQPTSQGNPRWQQHGEDQDSRAQRTFPPVGSVVGGGNWRGGPTGQNPNGLQQQNQQGRFSNTKGGDNTSANSRWGASAPASAAASQVGGRWSNLPGPSDRARNDAGAGSRWDRLEGSGQARGRNDRAGPGGSGRAGNVLGGGALGGQQGANTSSGDPTRDAMEANRWRLGSGSSGEPFDDRGTFSDSVIGGSMGLDSMSDATEKFAMEMEAARAKAAGGHIELEDPSKLLGLLERNAADDPLLGALEDGLEQPPEEEIALDGMDPSATESLGVAALAPSSTSPSTLQESPSWATGWGANVKRSVNAPSTGGGGWVVPPSQQKVQQQQLPPQQQAPLPAVKPLAQPLVQPLAQQQLPQQPMMSHIPIPQSAPLELLDEWFYQDPQGVVRGPFKSENMREWLEHGYFTDDLMIRRGRGNDPFISLGQRFPERHKAFSMEAERQQQILLMQQQQQQQQQMQQRMMMMQQQQQQQQQQYWVGAGVQQQQQQFMQQQQQLEAERRRKEQEEMMFRQQQQRIEEEKRRQAELEALRKQQEEAEVAAAAAAVELQRRQEEEQLRIQARIRQEQEEQLRLQQEAAEAEARQQRELQLQQEQQRKQREKKEKKQHEAARKEREAEELREAERRKAEEKPAWGASPQSKLSLKEIQEREEAEARSRGVTPGQSASAFSMAARIAQAAGVAVPIAKAEEAPAEKPSLSEMSVDIRSMLGVAGSGGSKKKPEEKPAWGGAAASTVSSAKAEAAKHTSLKQIQEEEARRLRIKQEQEQAEFARQQATAQEAQRQQEAARAKAAQGGWAAKIAAPPPVSGGAFEPVRRPSAQQPQKSQQQRKVSQQHTGDFQEADAPDTFGGNSMSEDTRKWCEAQLPKIGATMTLVDFCYALDDASDIREYLRDYLGSTPQVSAFATEFIERWRKKGGSGSAAQDAAGFVSAGKKKKSSK